MSDIGSKEFLDNMYKLRCEICYDERKIELYKGEHFIGKVVEDRNDVHIILNANAAYRAGLTFTEIKMIQDNWKKMTAITDDGLKT